MICFRDGSRNEDGVLCFEDPGDVGLQIRLDPVECADLLQQVAGKTEDQLFSHAADLSLARTFNADCEMRTSPWDRVSLRQQPVERNMQDATVIRLKPDLAAGTP
jgi:hypothetical protein